MSAADSVQRWELQPERSWDQIQEQAGELVVMETPEEKLRQRRRRTDALDGVRRGMERYLFLIIDNSEAMSIVDMKPWDRRTATLELCEKFIREYFDQNPISHLGIIMTANGLAVRMTDLSGNPERHVARLRAETEIGGEPSLQNALQVALSSLAFVPKHATREIIAIMGSLTTCDPGNIHQTIQEMKKEKVRCSVISLSADVFVFKTLANKTGGQFCVPMTIEAFRDSLLAQTAPPPITETLKASLLPMGFPNERRDALVSLCVCHRELRHGGFVCPRCSAKCCDLPTSCVVCGLSLLSSPHLARSYHHLYAVPLFKLIDPKVRRKKHTDDDDSDSDNNANNNNNNNNNNDEDVDDKTVEYQRAMGAMRCHACGAPIDATTPRYQCTRCAMLVCASCDAFIHDVLHNCAGCDQRVAAAPPTATSD